MTNTHEGAPAKALREVSIKHRDIRIMYEIDEKTIAECAEAYDIDWTDMKKVLTDYGITIRRNGEVRPEPAKHYSIKLVDADKIVKEAPKAAVVTAQ